MSHPSVETIKRESRRLRGTIAEGLRDASTGGLAFDDQRTLKFHGSYQQDDRDLREERRRQKLEPAHQFMVRLRAPGGVFTPAQWLRLDAIATTFGNHSLRATSRQTFQFHGIIKQELKASLQAIHAAALDTIAACGDVNRNVLAGGHPALSPLHAQAHAWARRLSERFLPATRAWYELWLDGEKLADSGQEEEPVYGPTYLPRKFKMAVAVPPVNDVDVFANDLGLIAIADADGGLAGFNLALGGGMGASHGIAAHYPRLASVVGFVAPEQVLAVAEAVLTVQRDLGNREERALARFKYTIDRHGLDAIVALVEERAGLRLQPARPYRFQAAGDRFGWQQGSDGRWHLTLALPAGRIADTPGRALLSALRALAGQHHGQFHLTAQQNLTITEIPAEARAQVEALLAAHGLESDPAGATPLARDALACVALPTCGLAMAEAERYLPDLLAALQPLLDRHGLREAPIGLRISGCPNGCSRPYLAEIALVGRAPGRYSLFLGGDHLGMRLNTRVLDNADEAQVLATLEPLLARYARERTHGERFGDFVHRAGIVALPDYPTHVRVASPDPLSPA